MLIRSIDTRRLGLQSILTWNGGSIPHSLQSPTGLTRPSLLQGLRNWLTLQHGPPVSFALLCILPEIQSYSGSFARVELYRGTLGWKCSRPKFYSLIQQLIVLCWANHVTSSNLNFCLSEPQFYQLSNGDKDVSSAGFLQLPTVCSDCKAREMLQTVASIC